MTLNEWFLRNNRTPLVVLSTLFVVIQAFFIFYYLKSNQENQVRSIENLITNIATIGIQQQNRPLIESTFEIAIEELGARSILLCKDDEVLYSFPMHHKNCNPLPTPGLFEKVVHSKASGFRGHSYYFYIPRFQLGKAFLWMMIIPILFLTVFFFFVFRLQRKLNDDILKPLENDLLTDEDFIISRFNKLKNKVHQFQESKEKSAVAGAIVEERFKISHNVRSLFQSLSDFQIGAVSYLPESKNQRLKDIVIGFKDILATLVNDDIKDFSSWTDSEEGFKKHMKSANLSPVLVDLDIVMRSFVRQKRSELQSRASLLELKYSSDENHAFTQTVPIEFKSILSNLVNNSMEAGSKRVQLSLFKNSESFSIEVSDDGKGVPTKVRQSLFKKGFSFDKEGGTGYGLFHAKTFLEYWKGSIEIKPSCKGACFEIVIPVWKPSFLILEEGLTVVTLDDDDEIHDFWKEKLTSSGKKLNFISFHSPKEFRKWVETDEDIPWSKIHFFIDSYLGQGLERGEQIIQDLGISEISTLVSHRFDDVKVAIFCKNHNIKIFPKPLLPLIRINNGASSANVNVS